MILVKDEYKVYLIDKQFLINQFYNYFDLFVTKGTVCFDERKLIEKRFYLKNIFIENDPMPFVTGFFLYYLYLMLSNTDIDYNISDLWLIHNEIGQDILDLCELGFDEKKSMGKQFLSDEIVPYHNINLVKYNKKKDSNPTVPCNESRSCGQ
ncbi:hypothetical protein GVAV_002249 [Gurleya vavrai]